MNDIGSELSGELSAFGFFRELGTCFSTTSKSKHLFWILDANPRKYIHPLIRINVKIFVDPGVRYRAHGDIGDIVKSVNEAG